MEKGVNWWENICIFVALKELGIYFCLQLIKKGECYANNR